MNPVKENRIGRFYLPKRVYESEDSGAIKFRQRIMMNILPIEVKECGDNYEFEAYSERFEIAKPSDGIPNYKILFVPPGEIKMQRQQEEIYNHFAD